jgi:YfiH family protein
VSLFYKDPAGVYRARPLDEYGWLSHGFGTRHSPLLPRLATLKQVHSTVCIHAAGRTGLLGNGDALADATPGNAVAVKTADCIPILLADVRLRAVAAVHAGWRGTADGIAGTAIDAMRQWFGTAPEDLRAAIGPGIGECCYEVGPEVAARLGVVSRGHVRVDLAEANRRQLEAAGVPADRIYTAGLCTMCKPEDFYSFRREREHAGRMYSFIGLTAA